MKVSRLVHAGIVVRTKKVTCLMDPIFVPTVEADSIRFDPAFSIDKDAFKKFECSVVVISHEHFDHFSVESLNMLDREVAVFYPAGSRPIEYALRKMGFNNVVPMTPGGDVLEVEDLKFYPTVSKVGFPEMGMLFVSEGRTCWNQVDSVVDESVVEYVASVTKRVDVLFTGWQSFMDIQLSHDGSSEAFPYKQYNHYLKMIAEVRPGCVVPTGAALRSNSNEWINNIEFPMSEPEFLQDVRRALPDIVTASLGPGSEIEVRPPFRIKRNALSFIHNTSPDEVANYVWRPDRGVPPLKDSNNFGYKADVLRSHIDSYLNEDFLTALRKNKLRAARQKLKRIHAVWQLDVVYPDNKVETRYIDFQRKSVKWLKRGIAPQPPKLCTSITASAIMGLLNGDLTVYSVLCCGLLRNVRRLYEVHSCGVNAVELPFEDPLTCILFQDDNRKYLNKQLEKIGVSTAQDKPNEKKAA